LFNLCFNDLLLILNQRIILDTNQVKELLQCNDKMKFDKWLKMKSIEKRLNYWICERKTLPESPIFEVSNNLVQDIPINESDILIINESNYSL